MKTTNSTVICMLVCLAFSTMAQAVSIGAGPGIIDFGKMVNGGYAEKTITVSTSGDEDLICTIEKTGDLKDWLTLDKGTRLDLPANSRMDLKVVLQVPENGTYGKYDGGIYIKAAPTSSITSGSGLVVGAGVKIKVVAEITDERITSYKLKRTSVANTEIGSPLKINALIQNTGNVVVKPNVKVDIYDRTGKLAKTFSQTQNDILPTVESVITLEIPTDDMVTGQYTARLMTGEDEQTLEFNIVDKGALALKGILSGLELNKIWVETGETTKITGKVDNTGEVTIKGAKLNVEIYLIDDKYQNEKLVKTITSDEAMDIPVGQDVELNAYYAPSVAGRYTIQGQVAYQGKKTAPKSTILNVIEMPINYLPYILITAIIIIGAVYWLTRRGDDGRMRRFKKIWGNYLEIK